MSKLKHLEENVNAGFLPLLALEEILKASPSHRQQDVRNILFSPASGLGKGGAYKKARSVICLFVEEYTDDRNGNNICLLIICVIFCFKNGFYQEAREALRKFVTLKWHSISYIQCFKEASVSIINGLLTKIPLHFSGTSFNDDLVLIKPNDANHSFVLLNELATIALALYELDVAKIIFDHLDHSHRETEIVVVKCNVGCLYATLGQYDKALEYLAKAKDREQLSVAKMFPNRHGAPCYLPAVYNNVGWIYQKLGKYRKAEISFKDCLDILEQDGESTNEADIVTTKHHLAKLFKQQGRFKDAMQELREARDLGNNTVSLALQGALALELLSLLLSVGESEESIRLDNFCREICPTIMNMDSCNVVDESVAAFQEKFAEICLQRGEITEAKTILENTCRIFQTLLGRDHPYLISLLFKLGCAYFTEQEYKRCAEMIGKAENVATETYGVSNPKLLPIYSKLAELHFYYFKNKDLAKQYVEKVMNVLFCIKEYGGSLQQSHLDHLKNTGILDSCVTLTVSGSCIVLHLCRKKLFEEARPHVTTAEGNASSANCSASLTSVLEKREYCRESELHKHQSIELSFHFHYNYALVKSLIDLATGLVELEKSDIVVTAALKSVLEQQEQLSGKGALHLLLQSCLCLIQAISSCKEKTNTKKLDVSKKTTSAFESIQREWEIAESHQMPDVEEHLTCMAALVMLCHTFNVVTSQKENKQVLQVYGMLSNLLQQRQSNHISDHYWFDTLGHMIYSASEDISARNGTLTCDFIVMESYPHSVARDSSQVSQQNISVSVVEDDGFQRRFNVIASSIKPVDINDLRILKNKMFERIKHTLEIMEFAQRGSFVVTINLKVESESIPTLCDDLELLPLLVYASRKPRCFELTELDVNLVEDKGIHNVPCKNVVCYLSQGQVPDSFLHKLLMTCFKEEELLGELCDFTEKEKSISLLSIKRRMTHISVSCKKGFIEIKINSLCSQASDTLVCDCALNIRHFTTIVKKCADSYGIQLEQGYSQTSCGQAGDCYKPIRRVGILRHGTVVQGKVSVISDGQQQPEPPEFVDVDFPCRSVDAHHRPMTRGQSETHLHGNVPNKINLTIDRSETEASAFEFGANDDSCITREDREDLQSRMDVSTQTEMLGIPPCLEKKAIQRVPERDLSGLDNAESEREVSTEVEFGQGITSVRQQVDCPVEPVSDGHLLQLLDITNATPLSPDQQVLLTGESAHEEEPNEHEEQTFLITDEGEFSFTGFPLRVEAAGSGFSPVLSLSEDEATSNAEKNEDDAVGSPSSDANGTLYHIDLLNITHTKPSGMRILLQRAFRQTCNDVQREVQQCKEEKTNIERLLGEALFERDQAFRRLRRQQEFEQIWRRQATTVDIGVAVSSANERQRNEDARLPDADRRGVGRSLPAVEDVRKDDKRPTIYRGRDAKLREKNEETKPREKSSGSDSSADSSDAFGEDELSRQTRYTLRQISVSNSLIDESLITSSDCNKDDDVLTAKKPFGIMRHTTLERNRQENRESNKSGAEAQLNRTSLIEYEAEEQTDFGLGALLEVSGSHLEGHNPVLENTQVLHDLTEGGSAGGKMSLIGHNCSHSRKTEDGSKFCSRKKPDQTMQANSVDDSTLLISGKHSGLRSTSGDTEEQSMETKVEIKNTASKSEWRGRAKEGSALSQPCKAEASDIPETDTLNKEDSSENVVTDRVSVADATRMLQSGTCSLSRTALTDTKNTSTAFGDFAENQSSGQEQNRETNDQNERHHTDKANNTAMFSTTISNVQTWNSAESSIQPPDEGATDALRSRSVYLEQGARPKQLSSRPISTQRPRERKEMFVSGSLENNGLSAGFLVRHSRDASIHQYAYHENGNAAMPTLPHEHRAGTADGNTEWNVDLDESFVLGPRSQTQPMIGPRPNSDTMSISDYQIYQMGQPEVASIHQYAYHENADTAMPTLPHKHRAGTADGNTESNIDLDNSFVLAARSQSQPMIGLNSGMMSISDNPSKQMGQPAAYSSYSGYNVGPSYSDIVPSPPFIGSLPSSHVQSGLTSQILFPSSSVLNSSSSDRNFGNNGSFDGTLTTVTYQTSAHVEQDPEMKSKSGGQLTESVSCEETETETEEVSIADEVEIAELANLSISSTESFRSEEERVNTLEARVAEACAMVERVFRERRAREQEIQEREQREREEREKSLLERERRQREEQEREARDLEERDLEERERSSGEQGERQRDGESGLEGATAATAGEIPTDDDEKYPVQESPQWLCEHYQRRCKLKFPCCNVYHPCHRCHNSSDRCKNESAKAHEATHLQCTVCRAEQPVTESYDTQMCQTCGTKLSEYFCPKCKHFTGVEKKPYHCDKCGICRIHKDRSFHCEVCNVCLDKRLEGKHKCRPDSGHDECCICLEDAFSGCQILPCSHKVHRDCAIAMIRNGIRTCPVCRHPLYSPEDE